MIRYKLLSITLILIAIMTLWVIPVLAAGEDALNGTNEIIAEVIITKQTEAPVKASIKGNILMLYPVPNEQLYNYFHIQIYPSDYSTDAIYDIYPKGVVEDYPSYYPLPELKDGGYNFTIRTAETYSSMYDFTHWIHTIAKNIPFSVKDGKAFFEAFPVYKSNADKVSKYRTDNVALDYYKQATSLIQSDDIEIRKLSQEITGSVNTDYEKARLIHDWVAENIWYDLDASRSDDKLSWSSQSALTVLHDRKAVCAGYSNLTAALMRAAGIPCKFVSGELGGWNVPSVKSGEPHAWNEAFVNGRWIFIDTTGDSSNYYEDGKFSKQQSVNQPYFTYDTFFDTPLFSFSLGHRIDSIDEPPAGIPDLPSVTVEP